MAICTAVKNDGERCKANAKGVTAFCRWHDPSDTARAAHKAQSAAGGYAKASVMFPVTLALASDPIVAALNLETPQGLRGLIAKVLHALTQLPTDTKLANAVGNLATSQRNIIEQSDIIARLDALEAQSAKPS